MDNTKDPVRVLREALAEIAMCTYDGEVCAHKAQEALRAVAAIPHSEQRETVAAGEVKLCIHCGKREEASELPPLPEAAWRRFGKTGSDAYTADQMRAHGQACIAHQAARIRHLEHERDIARAAVAAPPIAVQGSIAEDAEFHELLDNYCDSDRSDYEKCLNALTDYITEWADSRSPVAAAPDTARIEWVGKNLLREASMRFPDGSFKAVNAWSIASAGTDLRAAIDVAMGAAAPSADAKGEAV